MRSSLGLAAALLATAWAADARADLVAQRVDRFGDGETVVRYAQLPEGIPVIGRGSVERYSTIGRRLLQRPDLATDLPSTKPTLTPADAAKIAHASPSDAHLVIWPTLDQGSRLAYAVVPRVLPFAGAPRIIVDAQTGEILEARDTRVFATARVFESNPTKTPKTTTKELALEPSGGFLTNPFIEAHNCIDNKSVKSLDVGIAIDVHVCDIDQVAKADKQGNFLYDPIDDQTAASRSDEFSEVAIYYHASKAYAFFRDLQGDPDAQVVVDKPLRTIANLQLPKGLLQGNIAQAGNPDLPLEPFQNAFFAPGAGGLGGVFAQLYGFDAGALWFGQGPKRDYAYDGDVVYHEFTHAVVDDTLKLVVWHVDKYGAIDAPGAMNEGLADYFSSAITGEPDVGEYASTDLGATTGVIRTLDNQDSCANLAGEVHADSTPFSGGLWEARASLAAADRAKFDKALYKAMRQNAGHGDVGFEDLIGLFLEVLDTDLPKGATALQAAMTKRRLLVDGKGCDRVIEYGTDPVASSQKRLGFAAPGTNSVKIKSIAPGIIQIKANIPDDATQIHVSFLQAQGAGAANPLGGNAKPFAPTVLVKIGAPILWDPKSQNGHDAPLRKAAQDSEVTLDLPSERNGDAAYVQIASTGEADGAYNDVTIEFKTADGTTVKPKTNNPAAENPAGGAGTTPATQTVTTEEGCGISRRHDTFGTGSLLLGLAGVLAGVRARGRRRNSRA
ncbi:MAG: hypothetical protein U0270_01435 [Labilithrix sp.]